MTTKTRALGERAWIPWRTAATFGAVAAILSASVSWPLTTYLSRHGCANGLAVAQFSRMLVKPMSLPPICSVTTCVSAVSALNCGGFWPGVTSWGAVMSSVFAPLQEASVSVRPSAAAARWAKLWSERRQPSGLSCWLGISGPAAYESPRPAQSAAEAPAAPTLSAPASEARTTRTRTLRSM